MELTRRLIALQSTIALLNKETVFEGWAVEREWGGRRLPGLAVVTNWRILALDLDGGMSAIPTSRIMDVVSEPPAVLIVSGWHDRMVLHFDGPEPRLAVATLLSQPAGWEFRGLKRKPEELVLAMGAVDGSEEARRPEPVRLAG